MSTLHKNIKPPASVIFIFGGSGDLNQRKLAPALYNLFIDDWMPEKFAIVGLGRSEYSNDNFRQHLFNGIQEFSRRKGEPNGHWSEFAEHVSYLQMDAEDAASYSKIADCVKELEEKFGEHPNVIFTWRLRRSLFRILPANWALLIFATIPSVPASWLKNLWPRPRKCTRTQQAVAATV